MKDLLLRWGLCSAGKISNDFAGAILSLDPKEHKVCAVAAGTLQRAKEFAEQRSIPKFYGSYAELANDPDIDVVYVGIINPQHFEVCKLLIKAGKHVLCEKPLCMNVKQTKEITEIAGKKKVFFMEAVWSRYFPVYQKAKELIAAGTIGDVKFIQASFGVDFINIPDRLSQKDLGGGAILDIGIYPIQFAQFFFDDDPIEQKTTGSLHKTGVDAEATIVLKYSNNRSAVVSTSCYTNLPNEGIICGNKGTIRICYPFWSSEKLELRLGYGDPKVFEFKLPTDPPREKFNFINSIGLRYEAMEVRRCIMEGLMESPSSTHKSSIQIAQIMQQACKELGYDLEKI